ncbi:hypothetical protein Vadar_008768 [Vaccinium darrowii]|uniref:Uncharacterized protein n=1 Tax=Vaccinium darrowii TaxID=229202 RepID=A0ACB7ZJ81_9ERIC|nr:hypothetical protein Vadar_008768 [Vaccinium darrowii]
MLIFLIESQSKQWLTWCAEENINLHSQEISVVPLSVNDELAFVDGISGFTSSPEVMLEKRKVLRNAVREEMGLKDSDMVVMSLSSINGAKGQLLVLKSAQMVVEKELSRLLLLTRQKSPDFGLAKFLLVDYGPPFFRGCTEQEAHKPWIKNPLTMEVENVNNKPFVYAHKIKNVLDTRDPEEDEQQVGWVKDWINCYQLGMVELTDVLSNFPDISLVVAHMVKESVIAEQDLLILVVAQRVKESEITEQDLLLLPVDYEQRLHRTTGT